MLSKEEVTHVAGLARIQLTDAEQTALQGDLSAILDFFQELSELETANVEPIGHITERVGEARVDVVQPVDEDEHAGIKANFPDEEQSYLKVRSVL